MTIPAPTESPSCLRRRAHPLRPPPRPPPGRHRHDLRLHERRRPLSPVRPRLPQHRTGHHGPRPHRPRGAVLRDTAAKQLSRYGFTVEIETALQDEIDTEWTWGNYPFPWCTRDEVREVSAKAQRIHNDISEGRLIIHLHADDGHTTVAAGTYAGGVRRHVHLHGENPVRQVAMAY